MQLVLNPLRARQWCPVDISIFAGAGISGGIDPSENLTDPDEHLVSEGDSTPAAGAIWRSRKHLRRGILQCTTAVVIDPFEMP